MRLRLSLSAYLGAAALVALAALATGCSADAGESTGKGADEWSFRHGGITPIEREPPRTTRRLLDGTYGTTCLIGRPLGYLVRTSSGRCDNLSNQAGQWVGKEIFPGTTAGECLFTWEAAVGDEPARELIEAAVVHDPSKTHIVPLCSSLAGTMPYDVPEVLGMVKEASPCPEPAVSDPRLSVVGQRCFKVGDVLIPFPKMPSCPSCGIVANHEVLVILPPDVAAQEHLFITPSFADFEHALVITPQGRQAFTVPLGAELNFAEGERIHLH